MLRRPLKRSRALPEEVPNVCRKTEEAQTIRRSGFNPHAASSAAMRTCGAAAWSGQDPEGLTLTSVDHYAEGMENYVTDDLAGCRLERLTTKQLSVIS